MRSANIYCRSAFDQEPTVSYPGGSAFAVPNRWLNIYYSVQ